MAISSINFQKATEHSSAHNMREDKPSYLLPSEFHQGNEYWQHEKSEKEIFEDELSRAKRKGGPKPKLENSRWEAVVNLNKKHSLEDLQKVATHIEKKFNITATEISIHRDEGKIENGKVSYNYHAHLNFLTYKDGKQNWRKEHIKPKNLSELQTEVAELLGMERGKVNSKQQRLSHTQYKAVAREKEQLQKVALLQKLPEIAKNRDLQREKERTELRAKEGTKNILNSTRNVIAKLKDVNAQLKEEKQALKESKKATKEDYKELKVKYDTLKAKAKAKDLTIEELQKALNTTNEVKQTLETKLAEKPKEVEVENPVNEALKEELEDTKELLTGAVAAQDNFRVKATDYLTKLSEAQKSIKTLKASNDTLKSDLKRSEQDMSVLSTKNKSLSTANSSLQSEISKKDKTISFYKQQSEATDKAEVQQLKTKVQELERKASWYEEKYNKAFTALKEMNKLFKAETFEELAEKVKSLFFKKEDISTNEVKQKVEMSEADKALEISKTLTQDYEKKLLNEIDEIDETGFDDLLKRADKSTQNPREN